MALDLNDIKRLTQHMPDHLRLELVQMALDLFGIVDQTPTCDLASGFISLCMGDWFGAATSAISALPMGDAVKLLKLRKYISTMEKLVPFLKANAHMAEALRPLFQTLQALLKKIPADWIKALKNKHPDIGLQIDKLRKGVDNCLAALAKGVAAPQRFPDFLKVRHQNLDAVRSAAQHHGFAKVSAPKVQYKPASGVGKGTSIGQSEIWAKYDPQSKGYFIVRIDPQGHATKLDKMQKISINAPGPHGGRPHYHKEWVPENEYSHYLHAPTSNTVKYNDAGHFDTSIQGTHIPR
jgi:hypothetical protein